jgi:hypothetical protein
MILDYVGLPPGLLDGLSNEVKNTINYGGMKGRIDINRSWLKTVQQWI